MDREKVFDLHEIADIIKDVSVDQLKEILYVTKEKQVKKNGGQS